jgi:hypothetical protein
MGKCYERHRAEAGVTRVEIIDGQKQKQQTRQPDHLVGLESAGLCPQGDGPAVAFETRVRWCIQRGVGTSSSLSAS